MKKVCVMMSTYNGEKYLENQIDSVLSQRNVEVILYIRDDGSTDKTCDIVEKYKKMYENIVLVREKNCGPARSFWNLIEMSPDVEYYAFCDQDDIWLEDKLITALNSIGDINIPAVYYSKTTLADESGKKLKKQYYSDYQSRIPSFPQLVMENTATGCTMVFNTAMRNIARTFFPDYIRMHDHLLLLLCMYYDGKIFFDNESHILYRQHSNNVVGGRNDIYKYLTSACRFMKNESGLAKQAIQLSKIMDNSISKSKKQFINELIRYKQGENNLRYLFLRMKQNSFLKNVMIWGLIYLKRL